MKKRQIFAFGPLIATACAMTVLPIEAAAQTAFAVTAENQVVTFATSNPGAITSTQAIGGLSAGETLTGIDFRPLDGKLYTIGTTGSVYRLDQISTGYTAVLAGLIQSFPPPGTIIPLSGTNFGFDFNPTVDRIRLVSDADQNLRINPLNGGAAIDTPVNNGSGQNPYDLVGAAYTNSFAGSLTTTLYAIDGATSSLVRSTNANGGVYVNTNLAGAAFAPLGVSLSGQSNVGFDILAANGANAGFLSANDSLFNVDLTTGAATLIGRIGAGNIRGLTTTAVPEPSTWVKMLLGFGFVGGAMRSAKRRQKVSLSYA